MEKELDFCIICTCQVNSSENGMNGNGAVKRERVDNGIREFITADHDADDHPDSACEEEDKTTLFVLKNIFKVPTETIMQLNYGMLNNLVPLCPTCRALARQFNEIFEQVSRLQMTLNGIETEFMKKFQQNKHVQCQGSSSFWNQIRCQLAKSSFRSDLPAEAEESATDDLEEEWHFQETTIKTELADEPDDDDGEQGSFPIPAFTLFDSTSGEGVKESSVPPPTKKRRVSRPEPIPKSGQKYSKKWLKCAKCPFRSQHVNKMDAHIPLHEEGSQSVCCDACGWYLAPDKLSAHYSYFHKLPQSIRKKKNMMTAPATEFSIQCAHCSYSTMHMACLNYHKQVHLHGSGATACEECGVFVIPSGLANHRTRCSQIIRKALGSDKKLKLGTKGTKRLLNTSNQSYIRFKRGGVKKVQYGCRHCPYETLHSTRIQVHVELHEDGSQAVSCADCGWFLPLEQLETHRAVNHCRTEKPSGNDSNDCLSRLNGNSKESQAPFRDGNAGTKVLELTKRRPV